jgi:nicotinamidase-related amidase
MRRAYGLEVPRTLEEACSPARMALIVYDMQVGVLSQIQDAERIIATVTQIVEAARAGGFRVIYLRHMGIPNEVSGSARLRTAMTWQRVDRVEDVRPAFLRDSAEFALTPELVPSAEEVVFDKVTMSAFVGTPLDLVLRDCGIDSFAIVGVAMEVGIEPTARHAADLNYLPVVVADACGAGNPEAAARSLEGLRFAGDSLITDTATLCPLLRARGVGSGS